MTKVVYVDEIVGSNPYIDGRLVSKEEDTEYRVDEDALRKEGLDSVRVWVEKDEWYPVYYINERAEPYAKYPASVPVDLYGRYKRALSEFCGVANELDDYFDDHPPEFVKEDS